MVYRQTSCLLFSLLLSTGILFIIFQQVSADTSETHRRTISPNFSPLDLLTVFRWTNGRTYGGYDNLSDYVTANGDAYWSAINAAFEGYLHRKSEAAEKRWAEVVAREELVKGEKVGKKCLDVLQYMISKPMETEWSAKMIDSMGGGRLPAGLLSSSITELGDFDQCLEIDGHFERTDFAGKYCLATVNIPRKAYQPVTFNASKVFQGSKWKVDAVELWHQLDNKNPISMAVCFPSICKEEEIRTVMRSYYEILQSLEFNVTYCQSRDEPRQYNPKIWIAVTILAIPTLLAVLSLLVDCFCSSDDDDDQNSLFRQLLHCFSPIANTRTLVRITDTKTAKNKSECPHQQFHFLHGIRTGASLMIVFAHVCALMVGSLVNVQPYARYAIDFRANMRTLLYQPLFNGGLVVHTFFLISGMMMTYHGLAPKRPKFGYLAFVALRWLRYSPVMLASLCLTVSMELFGSGPLFHHDHLMINLNSCYDYWWAHLTYVQNILPLECNCNISSWYMGAEMQIHLVAYVLLVIYASRGSRATYIASVLFISLQFAALAGTLLSGWARPVLFHHYPFTLDIFPEYIYNARVMYLPAFNHLVPYFVGAIIGQALLEGVTLRLSPRATKLLWTVCLFLTGFLFTHTYFLMQGPEEEMTIYLPGTMTTAVLLFTMTLTWSLVCGWMVYQCAIDPGHPVARFLSAQIFQPFSKISFCLFLGHFMTTWFNVLQTRTTISLSANGLVQLVSSTLVQGFVIAYYLYLTWDAPFVNLTKLLSGSGRKEKEFRKRRRTSSLANAKLTKNENEDADENGNEMTEVPAESNGKLENGKTNNVN